MWPSSTDRATGHFSGQIMATKPSIETDRHRALALFATVLALLLLAGTEIKAADEPFDVVVTASSTQVMSGPTSIGDVKQGTRLRVTQTNADWYLVDLPGANPPQQGWIRKGDVQTTPAVPSAAPLTPALRKARLKERTRYIVETNQLEAEGKLKQAIEATNAALDIERDVLGADHPDTIAALRHLALLHQEVGDFTLSRKLDEQVLAATTKRLGKDHWQTINAGRALETAILLEKIEPALRQQYLQSVELDRRAKQLLKKEEYSEAVAPATQSLEITRKIFGEHDPNFASRLTVLAELDYDAADYAQAAALNRQALQIFQETLGEKHPNCAFNLNELGRANLALGDFAKAEPLFQQSLQIYRDTVGQRHVDYARELNNIAGLYASMGDYQQAEKLCLQAIQIRKNLSGEKQLAFASSLESLASLYSSMGDYAKAEPLCRQAAEIQRRISGETNPSYAKTLHRLGSIDIVMGDFAKAEPLLLQALQIRKQAFGEKHPLYAQSLTGLGLLYYWMRDYPKAEPLFQQSLQIYGETLGKKHPTFAATLSDLGGLYLATGEYAKAEALFQQALEIRKASLGEKHPDYAKALVNLGRLDCARHDYAKAEPLYLEALLIRKQTLGETHPRYAENLSQLAALYYFKGDFTKAAPLSRQALQISRDELDLTAAVQSERQQLRMADKLHRFLDEYLTIAQAAGVPAETLYAEVLAWKGAVSARQQAVRRMRVAIAGGKLPKAEALFDELTRKSRELSNRMALVPEVGHEAEHLKSLADTNAQIERLQQQLAALSKDFNRELNQRKRTPSDVEHCLAADMALVDLLEYSQLVPPTEQGTHAAPVLKLAAFVVRSNTPVNWIDLGPVEPIATAIESWRRRLGPGMRTDEQAGSAELKRLVWEKLQPQLAGAKTVLLSPDGVTAQFPWPALPGRQPGTYLIEDVGIAVVPIPRLLPEILAVEKTPVAPDNKETDNPSLLLLGDVDFDSGPGKATSHLLADAAPRDARSGTARHWPPLPATRTEMAAIADSFEEQYPEARLIKLRGNKASKDSVVARLGGCRYVHLATHGFFAPESPTSSDGELRAADAGDNELVSRQDIAGYQPGLLSGLVLAGANQPVAEGNDDGILTALEVSQLDLSHVELATLSACETGLGQSAGGEGLLGLQRAFQISGAKSVVATLWTVSDDASRALMVDFYDNLWKRKMSKLEALRQAQLKMLREGIQRGVVREDLPTRDKNRRVPPFYWAPFVLSGDWR
jgi:CHAT domain-containing protein